MNSHRMCAMFVWVFTVIANSANANPFLWKGDSNTSSVHIYDLFGNELWSFLNAGGFTVDGMTAVGDNVWLGSRISSTINVVDQSGALVSQLQNAGGNGVGSMTTFGDKVFVGSSVTDIINVYSLTGNLIDQFPNPGGYTTTAMTTYRDTLSIFTGGYSQNSGQDTHINEVSAVDYSFQNSAWSTYVNVSGLVNPYNVSSIDGLWFGTSDFGSIREYVGTVAGGYFLFPSNPTGSLALVTTSVVPLPAAAWLFGSGLLGLIGIARKKSGSPLTTPAKSSGGFRAAGFNYEECLL